MNLTIEQMREIVDEAPELGGYWQEYGVDNNKYYGYDDFDGSWYEYWDIPNAPMWQKVYSRYDFSFNRVPLKDLRATIADHESKMHSHLTSGAFQDDDHTDHVTDIRNHISPNTRVSEAHVNEAYKLNRLG